jgi:hypothetical protein
VLIGVILFTAAVSDAQVFHSTIIGHVTDPSGGVVVSASVTARHLGTNEEFTAATSESGLYTLTPLPSGLYAVTIAKTGFDVFAASVSVGFNATARVDSILQIAGVQADVVVTAATTRLQTDRADLRAEVTANEFANLPQPTRTYEGLLGVLAGVYPPRINSGGTNNPARSMIINANGMSNEGTDVRIEGISNVNPWVQFFSNTVPSVEAIETVTVVTNAPDVDQALVSGALINVQLKSGTNQLRGAFYGYHENSALKSEPHFLPANQQPPKSHDNVLGATSGGPVRRDRLFFFGSYEGDFLRQTIGQFATVPTVAMKEGDFSGLNTTIYDPATGNADGTGRLPFPGNRIPTDRISPITQKLLAHVPAPNTTVFGPYTNNFYGQVPIQYDLQKIDAKLDWVVSSGMRVTTRLNATPYERTQTSIFGNTLGSGRDGAHPDQHGQVYGFTASAAYILKPTFTLDLTAGFTKINQRLIPIHGDSKYTSDVLGIPGTNLGSLPAAGGMAQFLINGYTGYGEAYNYLEYRDAVANFTGSFTTIKGSHRLKWGFNIRPVRMDHVETGPDNFSFTGGSTALSGGPSRNQFNSYADFLLGLPGSWQNHELSGLWGSSIEMRTTDYSVYAGDTWLAHPRLTMSYGTGWEYFPAPTHGDHGLEIYIPSTNTYAVCGHGTVPRDCGIDVSKTLFTPRLGIAYRPRTDVVLRAGYGVTNEQALNARDGLYNYPEVLGYSASGVNPFAAVGSLSAGIPITSRPDVSRGIISPIPSGITFETMPLSFVRGRVHSYNATVQTDFGRWTLQVGYVGTRSVDMHSRTNINYGQVGGGVSSQPLYQLNGISAPVTMILPDGWSRYDALQATIDRRLTRGLQMQCAYTLSRWFGEAGVPNADSGPLIPIPEYRHLGRATMGQNTPHMFNCTGVVQSPFTGSVAVRGWQLNAVFTAISGSPFSILSDGTSLNAPGSTQRADQVRPVTYLHSVDRWFDPSAFTPVPRDQVRFGTAAFNSVYGPGAVNLDLSLSRNFDLAADWKFQIRLEAFNVTNTAHFASPGNNVSSVQYATNQDGTPDYSRIVNLNGFAQITAVNPRGRVIDERYFRLGAKLMF